MNESSDRQFHGSHLCSDAAKKRKERQHRCNHQSQLPAVCKGDGVAGDK